MAKAAKKTEENSVHSPIASPELDADAASPASAIATDGLVAGTAVVPPAELHLSTTTWKKGQVIHRIHLNRYAGDAFNPGIMGNARFSPIKDGHGNPIPTLYGGDSFECAAMETVFHDVSYTPGVKMYDKAKLDGQTYTRLSPTQDLTLADLGSKALRKLGVQRSQLIDTEKDQYPTTRQWAQAIHTQHKEVQGLCWTSRQDDGAKAVVLFGDRIEDGTLQQVSASNSVTGDSTTYSQLLGLAELVGVNIVSGKG